MKFAKHFFALLCCFFLCITNSYSFDDNLVHPAINEASSQPEQSRLDEVLKEIGFQDGKDEPLIDANGVENKVFEWIKQGGTEEDDGLRSFNHFYDPTKQSWKDAGLFGIMDSSLDWAQENDASWNVAREHFYQALTTGTDEEYSALFVTLGQLMHLISDKAVPAHVRDDAHPEVILSNILKITHFEIWAKKNFAKLNYNGIGPGQAIFTQAVPNQYAPLSALWDIDKYDTTNPSITLEPIIGLAEYSNANFFSEGTPFSTKYPYPHYPDKDASVEKQTKQIPDPFDLGKEVSREYWMKKATANTSSYRLTGIGYLTFSVESLYIDGFEDFETLPPMDEYVFQDYSELLIPRAVGYSATLLDYFFRGTIEIVTLERMTTDNQQGFSHISLQAQNTSFNEEEMTEGNIELVAKYKLGPTSEEYSYSVTPEVNETSAISRENPVELEFDLSKTPIPIDASDISMYVVYKGTLGAEENNAVGVGRAEINNNIQISLPTDQQNAGTYALTTDPEQGFNHIALRARDISADGVELTNGTITLMVKYRLALEDFTSLHPIPTTEEFSYRVASEVSISALPNNTPVELEFNLGETAIPANATDVTMYVLFNGISSVGKPVLGMGYKDISEPTPIGLFSNLDKVCLDGSWHNAGEPDTIALVGPSVDVYSHNLQDVSLRIASVDNPDPSCSTGMSHNITVADLPAGQLVKAAYVLSDYTFILRGCTATTLHDHSGSNWSNTVRFPDFIRTAQAVKFQTDSTEPDPLNFSTFRAVKLWAGSESILVYEAADWGHDDTCSLNDVTEE